MSASDAPFDAEQVERLLTTTKAVRRRLDLDRPVPRAVVLDCIRLASYAPNASNAQSWRWVVVTDAAVRAELGARYRRHLAPPMEKLLAEREERGDEAGARHSRSVLHLGEVFGRVPVVVVPCVAGRLEDEPTLERATGMFGSIYPAVWSFQLALRSKGLGSTFTTAHVLFEPEVRELLGVPATHTVACMLPVAYTVGTDFRPAPRGPVESIVYADRWGTPPGPS
jgi:nitroreductase